MENEHDRHREVQGGLLGGRQNDETGADGREAAGDRGRSGFQEVQFDDLSGRRFYDDGRIGLLR